MRLHSEVVEPPELVNQRHQLKHLVIVEEPVYLLRIVGWVIQQNEHGFRNLF
jgi:hypothetical protein